jgi:hypothetical protein
MATTQKTASRTVKMIAPPEAKPTKPTTNGATKAANGATKTTKPAKVARVNPGRAKGDFTNDQKITLAKKPEDVFLLDRYGLLKSGQTVGDALATFTAAGLHRRRSSLRALIKGGHVSVK